MSCRSLRAASISYLQNAALHHMRDISRAAIFEMLRSICDLAAT